MRIIICIIVMLMLAGCAAPEPAYIKDGKQYGITTGLFRHNWWNFYERGRSYAEGEYYDEAVQDLKAAIKKRKDDQWRSRTYGLHFVNYFPHRELGEVYYAMNKYDDADRELLASLKTAESSRAKFYLNRTRLALLEESGDDKLPPSILISSPSDGSVTNKPAIFLSGEFEDDNYVASYSINGIPFPLELSAKKAELDYRVPLKRGINKLNIRVTDLTGKATEKLLMVRVDREGPVIIIDDQEVIDQKVVLSGFITDRTKIASFHVNGESVPLESLHLFSADDAGHELAFRQEFDITDKTESIFLAVEDIATNVTKGEFKMSLLSAEVTHPPLLSDNGDSGRKAYAFISGGLGKLIDDTPPEITLQDILDFKTVYTDAIYLEGSVTDDSKIKSLLINSESVLKRRGKRVFFNYMMVLKEGKNTFLIEAVDTYGNRAERVISVTRKIPKIRHIGSRMSISVLPFARKGERTVAGDAVYDSLITSFINQKRFHLIERERIEEVLGELRLSQTELVDPGTVSHVGNLVIADAILTGTIYESNNSIEVITRLVDTETSDIMYVADSFDEEKSLRNIKGITDIVALKYKQKFPLIEGLVIKKDKESILTNIGEDKKIKRNMRLILFREGNDVIDPVSERILGTEPEELGEAKIVNVYDTFSQAFIRKGDPVRIKKQDKVITK